MRSNEPSKTHFYGYPYFKGTNNYIGYFLENKDYLESKEMTGDEYEPDQFKVDEPLFLHHGKSDLLRDTLDEDDVETVVFEAHIEVTTKQIYLAKDSEDFNSLFENDPDPEASEDDLVFTPKCMSLIKSGKRWFILTNDPTGQNYSFIANPAEVISHIYPENESRS